MTVLRPSGAQVQATDPARSNWVGANAGSGKTHVLTQRVARLLLMGTDPQKILCLTYTKAAAGEMQERLFRTLGTWAMEPEGDLAARLGALSGSDIPIGDRETLDAARRLFARALETPGGLKIQTIHAFCETLLRRFPLEAGISPRFEVADDRQSATLMERIRGDLALAAEAGEDPGFDGAANRLNEGGIDDLASAVFARRAAFRGADVDAALTAQFGAEAERDPLAIARSALTALAPQTYAALRAVLLEKGKTTDRPVGEALPAADPPDADVPAAVTVLVGRILTQKGEARSARGFPSAEVKKARPQAEEELATLTQWALTTRAALLACQTAARTRDLYGFASPLLNRYADAKAEAGLLDFDDLVSLTARLMTASSMRSWVLFKLDQGIDHILVDEAQDTAPAQWQVIEAIADEFLAGAGARAEERSIFVVGDEKQSIYSFQGAEPQAFGDMRTRFAGKLEALGTPLGRPELITSYRSAPAILEFVDAVFQGEAAQGLTHSGDPVRHRAHRRGDRGRVDLWPLVAREEAPDPPDWWDPVDALPAADPKLRLAGDVAAEIARMIGEETLPARTDAPARPVRPADVLVLVTRRDRLARGIIRALKDLDVPVAGADRLSLTDELAVRDLMALAKVAVMPGDDLALAALLRSPLCDVPEEMLFALAHGREGMLWEALRLSHHSQVFAFLDDMARQADFLRPYEFLERVLIRHDGRRKLLARLGPEAEDAIDELLAQALAYEAREVPSLASFIHWIEAGGIEVKRQMEQGTDAVRVMTVHGAKGLEAPVVILPDTIAAGNPGAGRPVLLPVEPGGNAPDLTLWAAAKPLDDPLTRTAREAAEARERAERRRLLYVALTRAEDWLILCGAEAGRKPSGTWYDLLEAAMEACPDTRTLPSPTGEGEMRRFQTGGAPGAVAEPEPAAALAAAPLPDWLTTVAHEMPVRRRSPSDLVPHERQDSHALGRGWLDREDALAKGLAVHALLEHWPALDQSDRRAAAAAIVDRAAPGLAPDLMAAALAEAEAVLAMPDAARIFGPDSLAEVAVAIDDGPGAPRMIGRLDRLLVEPHRVLIVDIKTDGQPPPGPEDVPRAYLTQLGAYRAGLMPAWPGRGVETALLWTAGPRLMPVPSDAVDRAFRAMQQRP